MKWGPLTKIDTGVYKGIAILMIATHNFMHFVDPDAPYSEFAFEPDGFNILIYQCIHETQDIVRILLSYFGHFGVQIFIFLSAYGLTRKYSDSEPVYGKYIVARGLKIYPAFFLAIALWAVVEGIGYGVLGPLKVVYWELDSLVLKIFLLSSFVPGQELLPVGPWWFIPFIFQFYLVFPLLLKLAKTSGAIPLAIMSIVSVSLAYALRDGSFNLYYTVVGHLPELCLGVYLGRRSKIEVSKYLIACVLVVFILGNAYSVFWYLNHISALILLLVVFQYSCSKLRNYSRLKAVLVFLGSISMQIFLVNGFLRGPFVNLAKDYHIWLATLVFCIIFLVIATIASYCLVKTEGALRRSKVVGRLTTVFR